jgi:hypothetical protein
MPNEWSGFRRHRWQMPHKGQHERAGGKGHLVRDEELTDPALEVGDIFFPRCADPPSGYMISNLP